MLDDLVNRPAERGDLPNRPTTRPQPDGWTLTPFGELFEIQGGSQPPKETFIYEPKSGYIRLLQIRDFGDKPVPTYIPIEDANKTCERRDILIARYGASLGRILTGMEGAYNVAMAKVIFDHSLINSRYVFYLLQTPIFQIPIHMISRSAQNGFIKGDVYPIELPLAPLVEQERIVAEIEKQFTRLDQAVVSLHRLQTNLARYKASVLKAACEGRLVPQDPSDEPAEALLQRILSERRAQWQTTHPGKKYEEPTTVDTFSLPDLPDGWMYCHIDAFLSIKRPGMKTGPFGSMLKKHEHQEQGIPVLGIENIEAMRFVPGSKIQITPEKANQVAAYAALPGDIIISRSGTVGEVCVVPEGLGDARISTNLMRIVLDQNVMDPDYFVYLFNGSPFVLKQVSEMCSGSTRDFLNQKILKAIIFPIPPLAEQHRIVAEVERRLSVITATEQAIITNLSRAERLRQSILHRAFTGQLV